MALLAAAVLGIAGLLLRPRPAKAPQPLPSQWPLVPRGVFSNDERRAYRVLRDALPHHVILSKLPLVRFCQPIDSDSLKYWYDLLGATHVGFAVCSSNGRVLAAIDIGGERSGSRRAVQIKQAVLTACRVRYLRCSADQLPSIAELQLLIPRHTHSGRAPQAGPLPPAPELDEARDTLAHTVATRRAERTALWQDSSLFHDSFFDPGDTPARPLLDPSGAFDGDGAPDDIVGVVIDHPQRAAAQAPRRAAG